MNSYKCSPTSSSLTHYDLCVCTWHRGYVQYINGASAASQDPIRHAHHVLSLIDLVLLVEPDTQSGDPVHHTLPCVLLELATFFHALDVNGQAHLIQQLAAVNGGMVHTSGMQHMPHPCQKPQPRPSQAPFNGFGPAWVFKKPKPSQARPKPGLSGQARPEHH
ncbi:hypothetical protein BC827DRAFT_1278799 [Russula dissimulans]|nr:hypothetical protein BC827DRAFT_1278799 [Russula dissimulans]